MTAANPRRLRAERALPPALRDALRELPNAAPERAQLDELRQKLGLSATSAEARVHPVLLSDRRARERRLRRTVVALVFFPIAATAAVGTVIELEQRSAQSAATAASSATLARSRAQRPSLRASSPSTVAPAVAPESISLPAPSDSAEIPTRQQSAAPSAAPASARVEVTSPAAEPTPATEVALLQRANAALKTDPARAQAIVAEHRQLFPAGNLAQEREAIAIKALVALGQPARARESLTRFERSYPRSAYAPELRRIVH